MLSRFGYAGVISGKYESKRVLNYGWGGEKRSLQINKVRGGGRLKVNKTTRLVKNNVGIKSDERNIHLKLQFRGWEEERGTYERERNEPNKRAISGEGREGTNRDPSKTKERI